MTSPKKVPIAGYVVIDEMQGSPPLYLLTRANTEWPMIPRAGILLVDNGEITLFRNRRRARSAIARTIRYMSQHSLFARYPQYKIMRLVHQ